MTQLSTLAATEAPDDGAGSRRLLVGAVVLALLACALVAYWLWVLRENRLQFVTRQVLLQTSAISEHASVVFGTVDAALLDTTADLRDGRIDVGNAQRTLRLRMSSGPHVRALSLADRDGRVIASSWSDPPPQVRIAAGLDAALADAAALRVSAPAISPYDGREAIELARTVPSGPSNMAQVVAVVDNHFVAGFFSRMVTSVDARVGLFALDGTPLGGTLELTAMAPQGRSNAALLDELLQASGEGAIERGPVFAAARRLEGLPLIVVTSRDRIAAMAPWRDSLVGAAGGTALALALLGLMVWRLDREVRARVRAQAALARTRERTRLAFEAAQEGTWSWNFGEGSIDLSPRMAELLEVGTSACITQQRFLGERIHPDDRPLLEQAIAVHAAGSTSQIGVQFRVALPQGGWRWVHGRGRALRDAAGQLQSIVGTASDETEARNRDAQLQDLQSRLQRTRRLESLGRLAGGIAHDFNNILAAVLGYGELMQRQATPGSAAARHLEQIVRAGERGRSLVARILSFSRGGSRALAPLRLEPVVNEALDLLAASLRPGVRLERELHAQGAVVLGDATQLFEAVSNLCANALHAMPEGGTLRVRVESVQTDAPRTLSHGTLLPGRHVCVAVSDTGVGMDADVLEHLFEPFFTTREAQLGTGLGLAMVHGAVKEMQGAIDVRSAPERGSTFALYFGLVDAPVQPDAAARAPARPAAGQVVMVVDDELALVALAEETLAGLGYEAVGFHEPGLALAALREAPERFDAVLTDQIMPGMTGTELARALLAIRPGLPILLVSGFGGPRMDEQACEAGIAAVLQKPLRRDELAAQIALALAAHDVADFI